MRLFLCGMPMVLMELIIGQYWAQGSLTVWKLAPLFKGIGFSMVMLRLLHFTIRSQQHARNILSFQFLLHHLLLHDHRLGSLLLLLQSQGPRKCS